MKSPKKYNSVIQATFWIFFNQDSVFETVDEPPVVRLLMTWPINKTKTNVVPNDIATNQCTDKLLTANIKKAEIKTL